MTDSSTAREFERNVEGHPLRDLEPQSFVRDGLEPLEARHHRIGADRQRGDLVLPVPSGGNRSLKPGIGVRDRDGRARERVARGVGHPSVHARFLGGNRAAEGEQQQRCAYGQETPPPWSVVRDKHDFSFHE